MLRILAVMAMATVFPLVAQAQEGKSMTDEQQDVLAVIERMTDAFQKGDIEGVMATYEDMAVISFEPGTPVSGPAVLREMFQGMIAANPRFDFGGSEVIVAGDIAVHFMPWTMQATAPDGSRIEQGGLSVAVLRKQADGSWRMVIDNPHGQRLLRN